MTEDVETRLRAALQYNADRVDLHQLELRTQRARRPDNRVWAAMAAAACVLAIVGATVVGRSLHRGATAAASYEGRHWLLTSIVHAGRTTVVPAKWNASVQFDQRRDSCAGPVPKGEHCLMTYDSVNTTSAAYRRTKHGFNADVGMTTAIATADRSRARQLTVAGIGSVGGSRVTASVDGHQLTLTTRGYTLIFTDAHPHTITNGSYTGRHWLLTSIQHNGKSVAVPARLNATIDFGALLPACPRPVYPAKSCPGEVGINDSVNFLSGRYRRTPDGFTTFAMGTTYVVYGGADSTTRMVISALERVGYGRMTSAGSSGNADIPASVDGDELTLTVPDYVLTLTAQGNSRLDTSIPSPTSTR